MIPAKFVEHELSPNMFIYTYTPAKFHLNPCILSVKDHNPAKICRA